MKHRDWTEFHNTRDRSNIPPGTWTAEESQRAGELLWKGSMRTPEESAEMNLLLGFFNTILSGR